MRLTIRQQTRMLKQWPKPPPNGEFKPMRLALLSKQPFPPVSRW